MNRTNDYPSLSLIYRALLKERGHFLNQASLVEQLCVHYEIPKTGKVLDLAAGTGDVLAHLSTSGFTSLHAVDGAGYMLSEWEGAEGNTQLPDLREYRGCLSP